MRTGLCDQPAAVFKVEPCSYQASCACGWSGPLRGRQSTAGADRADHARGATPWGGRVPSAEKQLRLWASRRASR